MTVLLSEALRKDQFIKIAAESIKQGKSIDILCIAGTAPLTERLEWLADWLSNNPDRASSTIVKITSVEASIYLFNNANATVNHNSAIDPNEEDELESAKKNLEELVCSLNHYSLCSEINGTKITRHMSASTACNLDLSTPLQQALDHRYDQDAMLEGVKGTTKRELPAALYGYDDGGITSYSTYAHDLKALFVHQNADELSATGILCEVTRLGIPTENGRIYFNANDVTEDHRASFEAECRRNLEKNGKTVLAGPALVDTRTVINLDKINEFDSWFLDKLSEEVPMLENPITVITDMGHGYRDVLPNHLTLDAILKLDSDPFNPCIKQDSDDHLVALELAAQQAQLPSIKGRYVAQKMRDYRPANLQEGECLVNRVVSDDCLNVRAVYEIAFALQSGSDVGISVDPTKNKPLPFANLSQDRKSQILAFAEGTATHLHSVNEKFDKYEVTDLYYDFYTTVSDVGEEIISKSASGEVTDDLKMLIAAHQSAVNALSQIPKVEDVLGVENLVSCMYEQNQRLQQAWRSYQVKKVLGKFVMGAAMVAAASVYAYSQDITWGFLAGTACFCLGSCLTPTIAELLHPTQDTSSTLKLKLA